MVECSNHLLLLFTTNMTDTSSVNSAVENETLISQCGKRKSNFSKYEKGLLSDIVKNYAIIGSCSKDSKTKKKKENSWIEIHCKFNSDSNVTKRNVEELKCCFKYMTQRAKTQDAIFKRKIRKTGGGGNTITLSHISSNIREMMPQRFDSLNVPDNDKSNW